MKQVFLAGSGQIEVIDVPVPVRGRGTVLVRTRWSLISAGTEGAAVASRPGLLGVIEKARRSPDKVRQVWEMARSRGISAAVDAVRTKLADHTPLGYSAAGTVVEVNGALDGDPAVVNRDPYGDGWMIKLKVANPADLDALLSADAYRAHIGG